MQALVLSPTRELAAQTEKNILALGEFLKVQAHCCIGGKSLGASPDSHASCTPRCRKVPSRQHVEPCRNSHSAPFCLRCEAAGSSRLGAVPPRRGAVAQRACDRLGLKMAGLRGMTLTFPASGQAMTSGSWRRGCTS